MFKSTQECKHMNLLMMLYLDLRRNKPMMPTKLNKLRQLRLQKPQEFIIIKLITVPMMDSSINHMETIKRDTSLMERETSVDLLEVLTTMHRKKFIITIIINITKLQSQLKKKPQ